MWDYSYFATFFHFAIFLYEISIFSSRLEGGELWCCCCVWRFQGLVIVSSENMKFVTRIYVKRAVKCLEDVRKDPLFSHSPWGPMMLRNRGGVVVFLNQRPMNSLSQVANASYSQSGSHWGIHSGNEQRHSSIELISSKPHNNNKKFSYFYGRQC